MKTIGSQKREKIEDSEYEFVQWQGSGANFSACLKNKTTGNFEEWVWNDDFAGYVIEINGKGFEFVTTIK